MYLHCYDRGNIQKMKVVDLTWIERDRGGGGLTFGVQAYNAKSIIECVFSKVQVIGCWLLIRQDSV